MRTRIKLTPETGGGACTFTFEEQQNCNRFCNNGGILQRDSCGCVGDFSGRWCKFNVNFSSQNLTKHSNLTNFRRLNKYPNKRSKFSPSNYFCDF